MTEENEGIIIPESEAEEVTEEQVGSGHTYQITGIYPLSPILVTFIEDGVEKDDLFYFSPADQSIIPGDPNDPPKDPIAFGKAFGESFKDRVRETQSKLIIPNDNPGIIH